MSGQEKFVTPVPLPTDREREILIILIEEAAEIQHRACKALRFGLLEVQPGQDLTNEARLSEEIGDLFGVVDLGLAEGVFRGDFINSARREKANKLLQFMQAGPEEDASG